MAGADTTKTMGQRLHIVPCQGGEVPPETFQHAPARGGKPDMQSKRLILPTLVVVLQNLKGRA